MMLVSAEVPLPAIRPRFMGNTDRPRPSHKRGHIRAADYCERARACQPNCDKRIPTCDKRIIEDHLPAICQPFCWGHHVGNDLQLPDTSHTTPGPAGTKRANSSDKSTQGGIEQNEAGRREENFKTGALNHSATLPSQQHQAVNTLATSPRKDPSWTQRPWLISHRALAVLRNGLTWCISYQVLKV